MRQLETDLHLFQPHLYTAGDGRWHQDFWSAARDVRGELHPDPAAILAILQFGYALGDRTIAREVTRKPWLSSLDADGDPTLLSVPTHGRLLSTPRVTARHLLELLHRELVTACSGRSRIYVQLSGGLDSRIISALAAQAARAGEIPTHPIALTWGTENSLDVAYAHHMAGILGLEWHHIRITPETVMRNIDLSAGVLGGQVSPLDIHGMEWFDCLESDALVLAGTYGDSIGRGEVSGQHILALDLHRPLRHQGLLTDDARDEGFEGASKDLAVLRDRLRQRPKYAVCEIERHVHYIRNLCSLAMSGILNRSCRVYQMFADPEVYGFMWSVHPAFRCDAVYAELLEILEPRLARIPWSRTNRVLKGRPTISFKDLPALHSPYDEWLRTCLRNEVLHRIDAEILSGTGLFSPQAVESAIATARHAPNDPWLYHTLVWLLSFQRVVSAFVTRSTEPPGSDWTTSTSLEHMPGPPAMLKKESPALSLRTRLRTGLPKPVLDYLRGCRRICQRTMLLGFKFWALLRYPPQCGSGG